MLKTKAKRIAAKRHKKRKKKEETLEGSRLFSHSSAALALKGMPRGRVQRTKAFAPFAAILFPFPEDSLNIADRFYLFPLAFALS